MSFSDLSLYKFSIKKAGSMPGFFYFLSVRAWSISSSGMSKPLAWRGAQPLVDAGQGGGVATAQPAQAIIDKSGLVRYASNP